MLVDGEQVIIVVGTRSSISWGTFWGGYVDESTGVEPHPTLSSGGSGGSYPLTEIPFQVTCTSEDGTATSVANKIKQTDDPYGPTDFNWKNAEYSAAIRKSGDSQYTVFKDTIFTLGISGRSIVPPQSLIISLGLSIIIRNPSVTL